MWEEVCCGLGVAKPVVALQIFMHWNNHILFYGKPFYFSHKNSREFATSVFLKSGSHRTIILGSWDQMAIYCLRAFFHESRGFVIGCYHLFSSSSSGTAAHVLEKGKNWMSLREKRQSASGGFLHCSALFWWTGLCVAGGNSSVKPIFML